jgi:hypothetical protein
VATNPPEQTVLDFFAAWNAALDSILAFFGPDPSYVDMPLPPRPVAGVVELKGGAVSRPPEPV